MSVEVNGIKVLLGKNNIMATDEKVFKLLKIVDGYAQVVYYSKFVDFSTDEVYWTPSAPKGIKRRKVLYEGLFSEPEINGFYQEGQSRMGGPTWYIAPAPQNIRGAPF